MLMMWRVYVGGNVGVANSLLDPCFTAFGDWGMNTSDFRQSAEFMVNIMITPNFTVLLGDNFYPIGVPSLNDPQWNLFHLIAPSSPKFYAVLGNHDYQQSVEPQLLYHTVTEKWNMPAPYYYKQLTLGNSSICALFLDTYHFDARQLNWTDSVLAFPACSNRTTYRFVFAHYPIMTVSVFYNHRDIVHLDRVLRPVLEKHKVHAYVSGHEHDMQVFLRNGVSYLIAGSISDKSEIAIKRPGADQPVWQQVNTSGIIQFSPSHSDCFEYRFISTQNLGEPLYMGRIPLEGNWTVETYSRDTKKIHPTTCMSIIIILAGSYVYMI